MSNRVQLLPPYINDLGTPDDPTIAHEDIYLRIRALEDMLGIANRDYASTANLAQVAYNLASVGGGEFTPTLFNTSGVSTLRGVDVLGFVEAASDLDARMTAAGL